MKRRILSLLLAASLWLGALPAALAEAQHTPYVPGELTQNLFFDAFQRGEGVYMDVAQTITLNPETLDMSEEDAALLRAVSEVMAQAQCTLGAVKLEDGVLLDLSAQYTAEEGEAQADMQLAVTYDGLALTSEALLPGERVTLSWEALLAMMGLTEEQAAPILALRDTTMEELLGALAAQLESLVDTVAAVAAPYGQTVSDFLAAQPVSVVEDVPADGDFPAAAQEAAIIITDKALGELIVALCDQLEQDATLAPMLSMLLMSAATPDEPAPTLAEVCDAVRAQAQSMTDEAYPSYIICGMNADGEPLYGSLCKANAAGETLALNLIARDGAPENGQSYALHAFVTSAEGRYSGLYATMDAVADPDDPQVVALSMAADIQDAGVNLMQIALDVATSPMVTAEGMSGYTSGVSFTMNVPDPEYGDTLVTTYGSGEMALTPDGGETSHAVSGVEFYVGDQLLELTQVEVDMLSAPGGNGPTADYTERTLMPSLGMNETLVRMHIYTKPYAPDTTLAALSLDTASEEDMEALLTRAMTNLDSLTGTLKALLPEAFVAMLEAEMAAPEAPADVYGPSAPDSTL